MAVVLARGQADSVVAERPLVTEAIVCGVDDSDRAQDAARIAARLCAELDLRLTLVHVAPPPVTPGVAVAAYAYPVARADEDSIEAGNTLLDRIAARLNLGERVTRHVVVGEASERLREIAADERAQFLVVGSRGRGLLKSAVLGSVSSALAGDAPCPVVVVPPGSTPTGPGRWSESRGGSVSSP
jgi:nucleotide-binding universal stress UspA family protein